MLVTDAVATALTKLGVPRHAETTRSGDIPAHWRKRGWQTAARASANLVGVILRERCAVVSTLEQA